MVCNSAEDTDKERSYLSTLLEKCVDGIILVSASGEEDLTDVLRRGIPIVAMDRYRAQTRVSTVRFDNRHAGYTATSHLMKHGHSHISLITGPGSVSVSDERLRGYEAALEGKPGYVFSIQGAPFTFIGGYEAIQALLKHGNLPSGIICSSDVQAVGAAAALIEQGLRIPGDVALVSIDGTILTAFTNPPLTAMRQPIAQMARLAVEAVLMNGAESHTSLKGELLIRHSCGCPTQSQTGNHQDPIPRQYPVMPAST